MTGALFHGIVAAVLIATSVCDIRTRRVPNGLVAGGYALAAVHAALFDRAAFLGDVEGMAALAAVGTAMALLSRGGLGGGDVKLMALMGLALGMREGALAAWLGFVSAGVVAVGMLVAGRRKGSLPLAPFLSAGGLAVMAGLK